LARLLDVSEVAAVGHLCHLWCWCLDFAQDGDLSRYSVEDIADAGAWDGDPEVFVKALVDCGPGGSAGFLEHDEDGGLHVHDWDEYAGVLIERREKNAARNREWRARRKGDTASASRDDHERTASASRDIATKRNETKRNETDTGTGRAHAREDQPAASGGGDRLIGQPANPPTRQPANQPATDQLAESTAMPAVLTDPAMPPDHLTDPVEPPAPDPAMNIHHALESMAGILCPPAHQVERVAAWLGRGMDMGAIVYACELAADRGKRRVDYIEGILRRWHAAGIRTRPQAEAEARARDPTPVAAPDFTELLERAKNRKRGADP